MFDLRKFWLGTAVYLVTGAAVITVVGTAFYAFVGVPLGEHPQIVALPAPPKAAESKTESAEIERKIAAPAALRPLMPPTPSGDNAATMPQLFVPAPLIIPERRSTRRQGPSRFDF